MTPDLSGTRILVVEDEPIVALDLQTMLEDAGATVLGPAQTIAAAQAIIETGNISLAVLDVRLNRDNIDPVADRLTACGIPLIFHTGHSSIETLSLLWPGCKVLRKPVDAGELMATVLSLIGRLPAAVNGTTSGG